MKASRGAAGAVVFESRVAVSTRFETKERARKAFLWIPLRRGTWGLATVLSTLVAVILYFQIDWTAKTEDSKMPVFLVICLASFVFLAGFLGIVLEEGQAKWKSWKEQRKGRRRARKLNRKYQWRRECLSQLGRSPDAEVISTIVQSALDEGRISAQEYDRLLHLAKVIGELTEPEELWNPSFSETDCDLLRRGGILEFAPPLSSSPAVTYLIGWIALIMGIAAGLNFGLLAFADTNAGPGILFAFLALASGLSWAKRKTKEKDSQGSSEGKHRS